MPSTFTTMATRSFFSAKAALGSCVSAVPVASPAARPFVICLRLKFICLVLPGSFFCSPRRAAGADQNRAPKIERARICSDKSPPHLRHEPEARCSALDMADSREVEMGPSDTDPVCRSHVQSAFPRRDRLLAIDVEHRAGLGRRHLQARHMHHV